MMRGNLPAGPVRISSRWTVFHKWLFPIAMLGFFLWLLDREIAEYLAGDLPSLVRPLLFCGVIALSIVMLLVTMPYTADSVYRAGDELIVSRLGYVERIALKDLASVEYKYGYRSNPSYVLLRSKRRGWFTNIQFYPARPLLGNWLAMPETVKDLQERVRNLNGNA